MPNKIITPAEAARAYYDIARKCADTLPPEKREAYWQNLAAWLSGKAALGG